MADTLEYPDVLQEVRGSMNPGRLKLQSNSLIFKNIKTGRVETIQASDFEKFTWLIRARGYCLKVFTANGSIHRFDGFKEQEYEKLSEFIRRQYEKDLKKKETCVKGWNWGITDFIGNSLEFNVDKSILFDVPLNNVSHTVTSKNEVTLEFHMNDDAAVSLSELRFHIPSDSKDPEKDPVNEFYQKVLSKADIIQATGDAIANFTEVQCLTPRGRYDIKIYQSFMQLHGKTFDYKIPYTTILRLFLLPHRDNRQMFFVVSVDPPIKQGMTRYHFLILLFNKEDETTLELALSERELEEKYEGKLTQSMQGPEYEIVSRVMKTLVNRKITVPGTFIGHNGAQSVACSYKAATGFLYPLERGFIFVHKPPVHIRFDEVSHVNFARSSGSNRSFDFEVETKTSHTYTFVSIEKEEYAMLYDFVKNKKLRVKNIGDKADKKGATYDDMLESDEDGHDAYMVKMKAEGQERDEEEMDDEDSSDDEDFDPDANEIFKEPDEEFDSEFESSESDGSGSGSDMSSSPASGSEGKPPKEPKEKKPKKTEKKEKNPKKEKKPGQSGKGKRGKKDPNAPKRPQSAFFLFLNDNREKIKEENPGMKITEITQKAGEIWRELSDKSKYEEQAVKLKADYEITLADYKENKKSSDEEEETEPSPKKKKSKAKAALSKSPQKTGLSIKSKEFISDESSSGDSEDSDKPLKKSPKKKEKPEKKEVKRKEESEKEESEKEESEKEEPEKEESEKEESVKEESEKEESEKEEKSPGKRKRSRRQGRQSASEAESLPDEESDAAMTDGEPISSAASESE